MIEYLYTKNLVNGEFKDIINLNRFFDKIPSRAKRLVQKNDILISTVRPNQKHFGFITNMQSNYVVSTGFAVITANQNLVNPYYLYKYFTLEKTINYLQNIAENSTSAYPSIKPSVLGELSIDLPSRNVQNFIANILKSMDDKIDLNKKIIANLEELSQTLFKHWFVDFEFPDEDGNPYKSSGGEMIDSELGEIPKGWKVKSLDEIANYINGLAMQKYPANKEESLPIVKIKELKNGFTDENSNRCTTEIPEKSKIDNGDIIFSWSATLLVKMWAGGKAGLNQHLFKVTSETFPKWFYYLWTKRYIEYFINIANDKATTMGHINRKHLSHAKIVLPTQLQLENFDKIFHNLLEKQLNTEEEIKRLIDVRDTLLPKLMSGELEIPDDIEVNNDELSI
ncbi:TPA: restriction endonuclease subunit S [Staphylococcus aureus]|nr:restriction endonuclease subunit S [Staphylococcus aureus]HCV9505353.1 restriction endonuclease subunit S [Staphylococcus aureus]HCW0087655.1 restriction endonuclease subunit S [Staphylococcus aureus]HEG7142440.1 restriction endonuclease subunit S [Staphylococcus aureus]HEH8294374.1 restriction endonuclease subunit S [Staphylococcus aureus]